MKTDIAVCGGGVAGVMAAVAAARAGASVLLFERCGSLGGTLNGALIGNILDSYAKTGIFQEFCWRLENMRREGSAVIFEAEKLLLEEMCREAGVQLLYYTQLTGCTTDKEARRIISLQCHTYDVPLTLEASLYIDSTGNGTLAALAGCGFDMGNGEGKTQPMSMPAVVCGLGNEEYVGWKNKERFKAFLQSIGCDTSMGFPNMASLGGGLYSFSINHEYGCRFDDAAGITEAVLHGRAEICEVIDKLRRSGEPAFEKLCLVATPECIGIRESRRVHGLYTVTLDDILAGKCHEDAVCKVRYWVDIHALDASGNKSYSGGELKSQPYDIPFRALLPVDCDNLILSGRCISGDFFAHASYRVVGNTGPIGEAAGRMAAKSIREGTSIKETAFG